MSSSTLYKWKFRVRHILDAIAENQSYVEGITFDEFCLDTRTMKAVAWNLTVIGEAIRGIPSQVIEAYPAIPWAQMRGMRNRMVHGYDQVDYEIVWKVATEELPALTPVLEQVIDEGEEPIAREEAGEDEQPAAEPPDQRA